MQNLLPWVASNSRTTNLLWGANHSLMQIALLMCSNPLNFGTVLYQLQCQRRVAVGSAFVSSYHKGVSNYSHQCNSPHAHFAFFNPKFQEQNFSGEASQRPQTHGREKNDFQNATVSQVMISNECNRCCCKHMQRHEGLHSLIPSRLRKVRMVARQYMPHPHSE